MSDEEEMDSISVWRSPDYAHTFPDATSDEKLPEWVHREIRRVLDRAARRLLTEHLEHVKEGIAEKADCFFCKKDESC